MATQSSILAWRIPWTEPGGLQSIQSQRVRHDWVHTHAHISSVPGKHKVAHVCLHLAAGASNFTNPRTLKTHTCRLPPRSLCSPRTLWSKTSSKDATRKCTKDQSWHFTDIIFSPINIHRVHSFIPGTRYYLRRGNVFKLVLKNNLWLGTKLCFHIPPIYSSNVPE